MANYTTLRKYIKKFFFSILVESYSRVWSWTINFRDVINILSTYITIFKFGSKQEEEKKGKKEFRFS